MVTLKHVAIIPDGNRRWAKQNNKPNIQGHTKGYERIREAITYARSIGIEVITVWAFSTENWKRAQDEVGELMTLITKGVSKIHRDAQKEKAKVVHIGRRDRLDKKLLRLMEKVEKETKGYKGFTLCLAIDYGGEDEITRADIRKQEVGSKSKELIHYVDTALHGLPSPDLIIRTGGENRTSGFMPLQSSYAEWIFEEKMFPDFDTATFQKNIDIYKKRDRRYGK